MRINSILKESKANGPGNRAVVWVQGCSKNCEGCFNNQAHDRFNGKEMQVSSILIQLNLDEIDGITVSGGEPFEQAEELKELLKIAKVKNLNTLVYSGFTYQELYSKYKDVLIYCDYLIDGPFMKNIPSKCKWAGSGNQRFLELKDGKIARDLTDCEEYSRTAEIIIDKTGKITVTGFIEQKCEEI